MEMIRVKMVRVVMAKNILRDGKGHDGKCDEDGGKRDYHSYLHPTNNTPKLQSKHRFSQSPYLQFLLKNINRKNRRI